MFFFKTIPFLLMSLAFYANGFASQEIVKKKHYTLNYNEDHEVANWVSYTLEKNQLRNCTQRQNNFRPDPQISTGSATLKDYRGSGLDRGHLVPAGDMKFSAEAMSETFFMSNMTPQPPKFNQGRWSKLETLVRAWAFQYEKIWIVTGPILRGGLRVIGDTNDISVPEEYFKVILRKEGSSYKGIAILMDTAASSSDLSSYMVTINDVEELAGHDFFSFLDNKIEEKVESQKEKKDWNFNARFEYLPCQTSVAQ